MSRRVVRCLIAGLLSLFAARFAAAQDIRVYTRIYDVRPSGMTGSVSRPPVVGRSTLLFHAGNVYDFQGSGRQITRFEPAHERFVLIDTDRQIVTTVPFEEINKVLYQARKKSENYVAENRQATDRKTIQLIRQVQFQMEPVFRESFDAKQKSLLLKSDSLNYSVKCASGETEEFPAVYLDYADWAARLNYVVNPAAQLPAPRLALNEALRKRNLIPTEIELQSGNKTGLHLRAEHQFYWKLDASDREIIQKWVKLSHGGQLRPVTLEKYRELTAPVPPETAKR